MGWDDARDLEMQALQRAGLTWSDTRQWNLPPCCLIAVTENFAALIVAHWDPTTLRP